MNVRTDTFCFQARVRLEIPRADGTLSAEVPHVGHYCTPAEILDGDRRLEVGEEGVTIVRVVEQDLDQVVPNL
ncbi:MAG: hypothetical protein AAFX94_16980 [Myxococcota bacterium]